MNLKTKLRGVLSAIIFLLGAYLSLSFATAELNPFNWSLNVRISGAIVLFAWFGAISYWIDLDEKNKPN